MLNSLGGAKREVERSTPSLPKFVFPTPDDTEAEIREAAARIAEQRTILWQAVHAEAAMHIA